MIEQVALSRLIEKLESGSRERGGSITSGVVSIGGTHLANNGGFRWDKTEYVSKEFFLKMRSGKIEKSDILVVKDGATTGKVSYVDDSFPFNDAAINEHIFRVKINPIQANPKFIFYYLYSPDGQKQILNDYRGATIGGISRGFVDKVEVPFPSIEIQNKIVAILDKANNLVEKRQETIRRYDELIWSIFYDKFLKFQGKKTLHLDKVAEVVSGLTKGKNNRGKTTRMVPYMRVANVQDGFLNLSEIKEIEATDNEIKRYFLEKDDLLLTEGGDPDKLGRGTLWRNEVEGCIFQNHIFRVRIKDKTKLLPSFLSYQTASQYGKHFFLKSAKQTSGIASINSTQIKSFPVYIPPLIYQKEFDEAVSKIRVFKERLQTSNEKTQALLKSLSYQAFSGNILYDLDIELEALIETIDLEKDDSLNDINTIRDDITFLKRLLDKLNEQEFENSSEYEKAKYIVFRILKEEPDLVKQVLDETRNEIKLTV